MKIQCSLLIALFFIFNGCSDINIQGVCRHNALYCASVTGEKYVFYFLDKFIKIYILV